MERAILPLIAIFLCTLFASCSKKGDSDVKYFNWIESRNNKPIDSTKNVVLNYLQSNKYTVLDSSRDSYPSLTILTHKLDSQIKLCVEIRSDVTYIQGIYNNGEKVGTNAGKDAKPSQEMWNLGMTIYEDSKSVAKSLQFL